MKWKGIVTIEMGRAYAAECGCYVTTALDIKENNGNAICLVDGGIHQLNYDGQIKDAYLINNVSGLGKAGQYYSVTAKLEKNNWHGLSANIAYTYSKAKVIIDGVGDQPGSAWKALVSQRGTNNAELGYASYVMPHRVIGNISYSQDYAKFFGTTVALSYYGGPTSRANCDYVNNVFADGAYNYSLIDIPTQEQLQGWTFKDYTDKDGNVTYSASDQKADFENYIQQDAYLSKNRGKIAERNGMVGPWIHKFDFKVNQNFYFYTGAKHHRHTIQVGMDMLNIGNLLSPFWGNTWSINAGDGYGNTIPVNLTNPAAVYTEGATPVFQFQKNGSEKLTDIFSIYNSTSSTWQMILSARYIF
jgi:hypothetical protein